MRKSKITYDDRPFQTRTSMILFFLQGCKRYFALAILFVCLLVLFELVDPKIMSYTVDFVVGDESSIPEFLKEWVHSLGGRSFVLEHLWIFSGLVIGIAFLGALCRYGFRLFNAMGAERLVKRMRDTLYHQIVHLPYRWQDQNKTGDIIQRCTSDVDMIKNFLSEQMTNLFRMIVMITLALVFMFRIHIRLTLVAALFIPVVVCYSFFFHRRIGDSFRKVDTEEGRLSSIAQENLTGVRVVRAFGRESYERNRFEKKNEKYTGLWVKMMRILSAFWVTNDVICGVQVLLLLSLGAYFTIQGEMSAGEYVAFMAYNGLLTFPVRQLGRVVSEMSKAGISIDRIRYIMNSVPETDDKDAVDYPGNGDIVFDHVTFSYADGEDVSEEAQKRRYGEETEEDEEKENYRTVEAQMGYAGSDKELNEPAEYDRSKVGYDESDQKTADREEIREAAKRPETAGESVIRNLSLTIRKGQTIGILGGTGSGKSTLIQLLDGLYELASDPGSITVNGVDIRRIKKKELRRHIGIVLQEPYLFSRTIEDNIRIARDDAGHEEVERVVETASLTDSIGRFADGYQTYVGERGVTLSGGQKQRTAIAQMLIREPDVMIFDDSLSAVDAKTDARIRHSIREVSRDTTCILISHRITTIMQADQIFVLDKGRILEQGTHEELMKLGGSYRRIFELQGGEGNWETAV